MRRIHEEVELGDKYDLRGNASYEIRREDGSLEVDFSTGGSPTEFVFKLNRRDHEDFLRQMITDLESFLGDFKTQERF